MVNVRIGLVAVPELTTEAFEPAAPVTGVGKVKLGTTPKRPGVVHVSAAPLLELTSAIDTQT
jgi:hypothetical protein